MSFYNLFHSSSFWKIAQESSLCIEYHSSIDAVYIAILDRTRDIIRIINNDNNKNSLKQGISWNIFQNSKLNLLQDGYIHILYYKQYIVTSKQIEQWFIMIYHYFSWISLFHSPSIYLDVFSLANTWGCPYMGIPHKMDGFFHGTYFFQLDDLWSSYHRRNGIPWIPFFITPHS